MHRGYADLTYGQMHYIADGAGRPLLLLHHTPRSCEFYRPLLPLLGRSQLAIALDTPGFGSSDPLPGAATIEEYAQSIVSAADSLDLQKFDLFGSNTGAAICLEVAATWPERVRRVALMGMPYFAIGGMREETLARSRITRHAANSAEDLAEYWESIMSKWEWESKHFPREHTSGEATGLARAYIADQLRAGDQWASGATAAYSYDGTQKLASLSAPALVIGFASEKMPDAPISEYLRHSETVASIIPNCRLITLRGGASVFSMITNLETLASALLDFFA